MIISDLNTLEVVVGNGVVGGAKIYADVKKNEKINVKKYVDIKKSFKSDVDVKGNAADAEAVADAYGKDTLAETFTGTKTDSKYSGAYSSSVSATNG
ncbi:hypothetical protein [Scytonema sp. NUACC26]|uniref:hypothetical protein n=1 Tax=Scytonema sp. NUACC26 TaxID=3140176 RepID=UPI0034DC7DBF